MKYLKMLGLVAVAAMALMAFFGAGSASGAVLCKIDTDPCGPGQDLIVGDTVTASLTSGTQSHISAAFSSLTCRKSHFKGKITNTGGAGKSVQGEFTEFTLEECNCGERTAHVTVTLGSFSINDTGTVTAYNLKFTPLCTGLAGCEFGFPAGGAHMGTFTESNTANPPSTAELDVNATLTWFSHSGGSSQFVCAGFGDTATWKAEYTFTSPDPLYLSNS